MTYDLSFLPEVEEDVISAYSWYEEKARGLGEEFLRMFMPQQMNSPETHCFTKRCMVISGVVL